jgi:hypothetical protein
MQLELHKVSALAVLVPLRLQLIGLARRGKQMDLLCEWFLLDYVVLVYLGIDNDLAGEFWL